MQEEIVSEQYVSRKTKPQEKSGGWSYTHLVNSAVLPQCQDKGQHVPQVGWLSDLGGPMTGFGVRVSLGVARGCESWEVRRDTQLLEK